MLLHRRGSRAAACWTAAALGLLLAACSKDKDVAEPAKLVALKKPSLTVKRMWSDSVGAKKDIPLRLMQGVSIADDRVYAAGHEGTVAAFDIQKGKLVWRRKTRAPLSGGTAASSQMVLVGSSDGRLFAFNAVDGSDLWTVRLNGQVLAPATISPRVVAVRTVDGKLHALSPDDGHELWVQQQQVPRLSLRGTARPLVNGDLVLSGFDNGKVMAVNAGDGSVQWETTVTPPHGRTELERLDDIDSQVSVSGHDVYAVGFQGRIVMLALETGQVWWSHDSSSFSGFAFDDDALYVTEADSQIVKRKARSGTEVWRQNVLLNRGVSAPAIVENSLVVGDYQGYVHFFDKDSGALAARVSSGSVRISTAPVVSGNVVVVVNDRGQISAWWVAPRPGVVAEVAKPVSAAEAAPAESK